MTWSEIFENELNGWYEKFRHQLDYNTRDKVWTENINPITFAEVMETITYEIYDQYNSPDTMTAEDDAAFEQYKNDVRMLAEDWEKRVRYYAALHTYPHPYGNEYLNEYFRTFWNAKAFDP